MARGVAAGVLMTEDSLVDRFDKRRMLVERAIGPTRDQERKTGTEPFSKVIGWKLASSLWARDCWEVFLKQKEILSESALLCA